MQVMENGIEEIEAKQIEGGKVVIQQPKSHSLNLTLPQNPANKKTGQSAYHL